jgi:2-hydroxychromene-2-carboxylate isomerase
MMAKQVEFYFDVGSPYSYLAYKALPAFAAVHGAEIVWRPMLLGGVFKATGNHSPGEIAAKGRWTQTDMQRWARRIGVVLTPNPHFPINTLLLMRGAVGVQMKRPADFQRYLDAIFDAMWVKPRNLNQPEQIVAVLNEAGFETAAMLAIANDPAVKDQLKSDTESAVARGVFGAPTFFVGDEMFWGQDRLEFVGEALDRIG